MELHVSIFFVGLHETQTQKVILNIITRLHRALEGVFNVGISEACVGKGKGQEWVFVLLLYLSQRDLLNFGGD